MAYKFDTQYFAVTEKSVLLLRNRFPYQEILPENILRVEFTKGSDVKRPTASIVFGLIFIFLSIYIILNFIGYTTNILDLNGGRGAAKSYAYLLIIELLLLGLGSHSIYRALPIHHVIKFSLSTGQMESLSIGEILKQKRIGQLIQSLEDIIDHQKIHK